MIAFLARRFGFEIEIGFGVEIGFGFGGEIWIWEDTKHVGHYINE